MSTIVTDRSFSQMFARTEGLFRTFASEVHTERWQGADISKRPDMVSYELLNWHCNLSLEFLAQFNRSSWQHEHVLSELAQVVMPNLPWADDHFLERVSGAPLNPGVQWANWPWASSADKHRSNDQFNHTYSERLWPKFAGMVDAPVLTVGDFKEAAGKDIKYGGLNHPNRGIRHEYGDLNSLVEMLANEPLTRQAWIPLFFPEDTGIGDGGRKPCTLGYQLIMRDNHLSIFYPLRSCDFVRHFRDDIYLAIRLLLWVLDRCRKINPQAWEEVTPGYYAMHCTSLHIFKNDMLQLVGSSTK